MQGKACQQANHLAKTKNQIGAPMKAQLECHHSFLSRPITLITRANPEYP
ncbi:hypothetical protein EV13_2330 [Prochlorococcus sp. MIT 0702]|nr:hypothetical protein EV12_1950 [Prochlorococcus sp. MIT 0701]KGG26869.1 hypothetical protein EV13_2330 [Prochlorococcus sp. MIT 0702]KGG36145.1 hypothetical protein EV14_0554 [Prochlorococcus sp. MIT 0703]